MASAPPPPGRAPGSREEQRARGRRGGRAGPAPRGGGETGARVLEESADRQLDHLGHGRAIDLIEIARQLEIADQKPFARAGREGETRAPPLAQIDPAAKRLSRRRGQDVAGGDPVGARPGRRAQRREAAIEQRVQPLVDVGAPDDHDLDRLRRRRRRGRRQRRTWRLGRLGPRGGGAHQHDRERESGVPRSSAPGPGAAHSISASRCRPSDA